MTEPFLLSLSAIAQLYNTFGYPPHGTARLPYSDQGKEWRWVYGHDANA